MPDVSSVVSQSKSFGFMVMVNAPIAKQMLFHVVMVMNALLQHPNKRLYQTKRKNPLIHDRFAAK